MCMNFPVADAFGVLLPHLIFTHENKCLTSAPPLDDGLILSACCTYLLKSFPGWMKSEVSGLGGGANSTSGDPAQGSDSAML
jgi:hypothetical protein